VLVSIKQKWLSLELELHQKESVEIFVLAFVLSALPRLIILMVQLRNVIHPIGNFLA
jgi:hypothetical protein